MLPPLAQILAVVLSMVALIGCTDKNDYNLVVGVGILYLGSKHFYLYNLTSFYVLLVLTIPVDIIQIIATTNQGPFMRYVITILEIILKIGILISLRRKASSEDEQLHSHSEHKQMGQSIH